MLRRLETKMRRILVFCWLAALPLAPSLAAPAPGPAPTPAVHRTMTCPIGGASFDFAVPVPTTGLAARPDGKPYGVAAPGALPECPDNGLILYKDYDEGEIAKLKPLIASDEYQALRKDGGQYYRAYWLMRKMGLGPEDYLWALLQASWEAEGKPELRARYLGELAEQSAKAPAAPSDLDWIGMEGRSINALRELGRFDEAAARLQKVPLGGLDVRVPEGSAATAQAVNEARVRRAWLGFFQGLKAAIARKDASLEPFDVIPRGIALGYCIDRAADALDAAQHAFCDKEQAAIDEMRANRARAEADMKALGHSREESGR
jgi:hypothetical protein